MLFVFGFSMIVLIPAADIVILDARLRHSTEGFLEQLGALPRRGAGHTGPLLMTYAFLVLLVLTAGLVFLPFLLLASLTSTKALVEVGFVVMAVAVGAALGIFGLALPAVILERRTATEAIDRAWRLARLRPVAAGTLGAAVVVVGLLLEFGLSTFSAGVLQGSGGSTSGQLVAFTCTLLAPVFLDMAWSSILVTAYHGLVAEEAEVVGRSSRV
jgi:hypothetical protein